MSSENTEKMDVEDLVVLVIDDSSFIRNLMKQMLRSIGVRNVHLATDGEKGLFATRKVRPHVVFCDLDMEPMGGLDYVDSLRKLADEQVSNVPVIILTMHDDESTIKSAARKGIDDYLLKPVSAGDLKERIEKVLKRYYTE